MSGLKPPRKSVELDDVGARELSDHSDDEHFSDASEGRTDHPSSIPTTRVERTDDQPSYGEIAGTSAHAMRKEDAQPDELAVIPEKVIDSSKSNDIPKTVVEKIDPSTPTHGEVPGTLAYDLRHADAEPDEVRKAPQAPTSNIEGTPTPSIDRASLVNTRPSDGSNASLRLDSYNSLRTTASSGIEDVEDKDDDTDTENDGDEFGAFDEGEAIEDRSESSEDHTHAFGEIRTDQSTVVLDLNGLSGAEEFATAAKPFIDTIFPHLKAKGDSESIAFPDVSNSFLTERSQSLWTQLVAPPPLQPPNWIRSRIRRLFLVSLGVPVDLDEILPASKQNKLVLPSIDIDGGPESGRIANGQGAEASKHTEGINGTSRRTDVSNPANIKTKDVNLPPTVDLNSARLLCSTTEEALTNLTPSELRLHLHRLEQLKEKASENLAFWLIQRDGALSEKETLEEVIENLVKHAQKHRR